MTPAEELLALEALHAKVQSDLEMLVEKIAETKAATARLNNAIDIIGDIHLQHDALDRLAILFRQDNWQIRGSGADFIEACAEIVGEVRDINA